MDTKISKAERTRRYIIDTTAVLFNTKGYAGTSMSDITEATGLTKGSIYGNFENKEEVALAAFDHNLNIISKTILERINKAETYQDKLMVYAKVYHSYTGSAFSKGGCPILNTAIEADDTDDQLKERAAKAILRWKKGISNLLQAGAEAGELKAGIDHEEVSVTMIALIEGGLMLAKLTDSPPVMDTIMKSVTLLVKSLKASKQYSY
jgi:AcrR family transcriptional regulator